MRRIMPVSMRGYKKDAKAGKVAVQTFNLWNCQEHAIFLKYCPSNVIDFITPRQTICQLGHVKFSIRIKDVLIKLTPEGVQYAEIVIRGGKTKPRTLLLTNFK